MGCAPLTKSHCSLPNLGIPITIGEELILPAVSEVLRTVLHKPAAEIMKKIPLSNSTVQRRLDEMAADLDETVLPRNEALLLAYVRQLETDTKGQSIFLVVEEFFREKRIPLANIMAVATDGAPSMNYWWCTASFIDSIWLQNILVIASIVL
uniref:DUF4371 domain-containing protein n=1 Tax=Trichuris muris TaxID=70415 RepID=A0A5S6R5B3_TRIMR